MVVVTAGVHHSLVLRREVAGGLFSDRKSVYVAAQSDTRSFLAASQHSNDTGLHPDIYDLDTEILKDAGYIGRCTVFLGAGLRVPVKVPEELKEPLRVLLCDLIYTFGKCAHELFSPVIFILVRMYRCPSNTR